MRVNLACIGNRFNMYRNVIALLYHALADLGHDVNVSHNEVQRGALNIVLPPMAFRAGPLVEALRDPALPYAVLGIETFDGYAHRSHPEGPDEDPSFRAFLENATAVLCPFRADIGRYRPLTPRPLPLRYGVHPRLEEIPDAAERPVDVFFFGDLAPYPGRRRMLAALEAAGLAVDVIGDAGAAPHELVRNARIARARVQLNFAHADHVSPQRVVYLANNRCCCVSNRVADPDGYLEAAIACDADALVETCRALAADGAWRAAGEAAYERARAWPMTRIVEAALDAGLATPG